MPHISICISIRQIISLKSTISFIFVEKFTFGNLLLLSNLQYIHIALFSCKKQRLRLRNKYILNFGIFKHAAYKILGSTKWGIYFLNYLILFIKHDFLLCSWYSSSLPAAYKITYSVNLLLGNTLINIYSTIGTAPKLCWLIFCTRN